VAPPRPAGDGASAPLERRLLTNVREIDGLAGTWRRLVDEAARSAFESPDWLVPWLHHYGGDWEPRVLTWWTDESLVGIAPLVRRRESMRGLPVRRLAFFGETRTPLRGWVDIVAADPYRSAVTADFRRWLEDDAGPWDTLDLLRLPFGSSTPAALERGPWRRASLTGVVRSVEYVVAIPADAEEWPGPLGRKARYNLRREARLYEEEAGGAFERVADPGRVDAIVSTLRELLAARWGANEAYFTREPRWARFLGDVMSSGFASGSVVAFVARRAERVDGCVLTLTAGRSTVPFLVAFRTEPDLARYSVGKSLFARSIQDAAARGAREYDFLTIGDYKESFWGAEGRALESSVLGRGPVGRAVAGYAGLRRRTIPRLLRRRSREAR
jgi:CelD/BcsL family acetyltransferase involved in cellulose biosynthesis